MFSVTGICASTCCPIVMFGYGYFPYMLVNVYMFMHIKWRGMKSERKKKLCVCARAKLRCYT